MSQRKIIHVDMDCFYAAVEMRDNPALKNIPIAIGGSSDRRGVIATCNYPARKFGVRSAMATAQALKLCPNLTLVKGRMEVYAKESQRIRAIFADYTDIIEPLSLDEAYLDVTDSPHFKGSATCIAQAIRQRIERELGLTASAGVASCKFVAKVASDENKPNGICVVTPQHLDSFVKAMSLKKIPGVGKVTLLKLNRLGLHSCEDVRKFPKKELQKLFGKFGDVLWERAHGIDERELCVSRDRKSIGVERTLSADLSSVEECESLVPKLLETLKSRISRHKEQHGNRIGIRTLGVKLKFQDFQQTTVEHRQEGFDEGYFLTLLQEAYSRSRGRGVRLVGLHVGLSQSQDITQLSFPF